MRIKAIQLLRPDANWSMLGDVLTWLEPSMSEPTELEIQTEINRLEIEYNNTSWLRNRIKAYSELNQDELRFNDLENNTTTWQDAINAIKAKYPKPS